MPIPTVTRHHAAELLDLSVTAFADGPPGKSWLAVTYTLKNTGDAQARGTLYRLLSKLTVWYLSTRTAGRTMQGSKGRAGSRPAAVRSSSSEPRTTTRYP